MPYRPSAAPSGKEDHSRGHNDQGLAEMGSPPSLYLPVCTELFSPYFRLARYGKYEADQSRIGPLG
jgi:hypothetical protein